MLPPFADAMPAIQVQVHRGEPARPSGVQKSVMKPGPPGPFRPRFFADAQNRSSGHDWNKTRRPPTAGPPPGSRT